MTDNDQSLELSQDNIRQYFTHYLHADENVPLLIENNVLPTQWYGQAALAAYDHFSIGDVIALADTMNYDDFVKFDKKLSVLKKEEAHFPEAVDDSVDEYYSYMVFTTTLRRLVKNRLDIVLPEEPAPSLPLPPKQDISFPRSQSTLHL